jgi:endonuclease/exonuclease/phosphatase family metal-dependent hydrolase
VRVLTWNLKHGRSVPSAGHELFDEFAAALSGWDWDVALLQEVPPWWPERLPGSHRLVLTSRNFLLPLRRWVAERRPDLIKSNGGGCNAILVREMSIDEHRVQRLGWLPERRWMHAVRLGRVWVANLHAQASPQQARVAAATTLAWAGGEPAVLGGDFNLRALHLDGLELVASSGVDHVLVRSLRRVSEPQILDRGRLSDHDPLSVEVALR